MTGNIGYKSENLFMRLVKHSRFRKIMVPVTAVLSVIVAITVAFLLMKPATTITKINPDLSVEYTNVQLGQTAPLTVKATGAISAEVFTLTFSGDGAGLSEEYIFENEQTSVIDTNGNTIILNREIGGNGAVNYWFELENGQQTEFSLNCISGVFVTTVFDLEDYKSRVATDDEATIKTEVEQMIKADNEEKLSSLESASLCIVGGCGETLDDAKLATVYNDTIEITWFNSDNEMPAFFSVLDREETIDGGNITDTAWWTFTYNTVYDTYTLTIDGTGDMPDYSSTNTPWQPYKSKITNIVIKDGITSIGADSFYSSSASSVSIGKGVTKIGGTAFYLNDNLKEIVIPGNVKSLDRYALAYTRSLESVVFEEGLETLGPQIFDGSTALKTVYLPSTVESLSTNLFNGNTNLTEIYIAADNPFYFASNGIIYKITSDTTAQIFRYLEAKKDKEFTVPATVNGYNITSVGERCFAGVDHLRKVTIPSTITEAISGIYVFLNITTLEEVVFEEGVTVTNPLVIDQCSKLHTVTYFDSIIPSGGGMIRFRGCPSLKYIYVPTGVKNFREEIFGTNTTSVSTVYYNTIDAATYSENTETLNKFQLIIGEAVDYLRGIELSEIHGYSFQRVLTNADSVNFIGENQITISEGVFANMPDPLNNLVGTIWVDSQGVVYKYDALTLSASVAYVPFDITHVTIPATIEPEDGVVCTINTVDKNAFKLAQKVTKVYFNNIDVIEYLPAYAFAYAGKLADIDGFTTVEDVENYFADNDIELGYRALYNTALKNLSGESIDYDKADGTKLITLVNDGFQPLFISAYQDGGIDWIGNDSIGKYSALTGETVSINMSMGNIDVETKNIYRVYFEFSDNKGSLSINPGETKELEGTTFTCYSTDIPNVVYVEFIPTVGTTVNTAIDAAFPSPSSAGGGLKVWGFILPVNSDGSSPYQGELIEYNTVLNSDGTVLNIDGLHIQWSTQRDEFLLTKASSGSSAVNITGDNNGNLIPSSNLVYTIDFNRKSSDTSYVGKDYVKSVDFNDYLDFGEYSDIIEWNSDVITAIKNGDTYYSSGYFYAGDTQIAYIKNTGVSISSGYVEYDEALGVILHWSIRNSSLAAEIGTAKTTLTIYPAALSFNAESINSQAGTKYVFENKADANIHYTYSEDEVLSSSAQKAFALVAGSVNLSKSSTASANYFGSEIMYTIRVYNNGSMPYDGVAGNIYYLYEDLSDYTYITADNMELMLDEYKDALSFNITNAVIYPRHQVTSQDNGIAYITGVNSDVEATTEDFVISYDSAKNAITIQRGDGSIITVESSLQQTLDSIGYSVGFDTTTILRYNLNSTEEDFNLFAGENRYLYVYANFKDTFMMLDGDYLKHYPNESAISTTNRVYLYRSGNKNSIKNTVSYGSMKREAYIYKSASLNKTGEVLGDDFSVELDDVIDYKVEFLHYGNGQYKNMPLIDDIYGTQVLLVPVNENPHLKDSGLDTATALEDGKKVLFYKLSKSGTYKNVAVGLNQNGEYMIADSITVTAVGEDTDITLDGEVYTYSGLQTSVNWYFSELYDDSFYYFSVDYHTLVDSQQLHSSKISTGNIVWMNDKTDDRIYDLLWGYGSLISSDKEIVTLNDDGTYTPDPDDYTIIGNGDSVTYRLSLHNPNDYNFTINGTYFYDELPFTGDIFEWGKDVNVSVYYEETDGVTVSNLDNWYIDDQIYGVYQDGIQFIKWNADTVLTLKPNEKFNIYVTLQYPDNNDNSIEWSEYYQSVNGNRIKNSFVLYGEYHTVYHSLKEKAAVTLQKGVYATYRYKSTSSYEFTETESRVYYNNHDSSYRAISYYVMLYNDGYTRLYLNDIHDKLPKGFKYLTLMNSITAPRSLINTIKTKNTNDFTDVVLFDENAEPVKYVSAGVTAVQNEGYLSFEFSSGSGENSVKYDIEEKKYYLEHNEAIVFTYICSTGLTADTEDVATNTIGMEYYDYLGAGVSAVNKDRITINAKMTNIYDQQNDGSRDLFFGSDVSGIYEFANTTTENSQWLFSDVSVIRGGIIPGVTNYTDSFMNFDSEIVNPYKTSVSPYATINWRSRLHNSGTASLNDYTFINKLPIPYSYTGTVAMNIYDGISNTPLNTYKIFTINKRTDKSLSVSSANGGIYTLPLDGTPVKISFATNLFVTVSVLHNSAGQEILTLNFNDRIFAIPENGGYVDITLSSNNITDVYKNTVYTNFSYLIPNVQQYDSAAQGSLVFDNENINGIVNTSPVNVSTGYSTTSLKSVVELNNPENITTSDSEKKYIVLNKKQSEFKYILKVTNDTEFSMTKLILIDSLPQIGDHSPFDNEALRGSEFKVSLAQIPDFKLTVYPEEGESYTLSSDYFTVGYSSNTTFTAQDWSGATQWTQWNENTTDVRSLRLFFSDSTASQIPPHAKVEFSFNAVVDDENAKAGMTAWNSFGYHYGLDGVPFELEAMPLSVGVKVPDVPTLQKKLVDLKGNTFNALSDDTFSFIIYSGDAITSQYNTTAEFLELLEADSREHTQVNLTVTEGESVSDKIKLELTDWVWTKGNTYTIAEITENDDYSLLNWNNANVKHISFVYDPDRSISYTCTNTWQRWSFEVLKTDGVTNAFLNNAVFALYSPYEADLISDEKYNALTTKPQMIYTDTNSVNWYLCDIKTTNESGLCTFEKLNRASYYLIEAKSPDGYKLDLEPRLITNSQLSTQVEIKNYTMTVLPFTGGNNNLATIGVIIFTIAVFALVFLIVRKKHLKAL